MRSICVIAVALVMSAPNGVQVAEGQTGQAAPAASPPAANSAAPAVAEQADRLLKQLGDYVGSAQQFTFHADIAFDHVLPSGQKLQYSASEDVALQRPGGLYVDGAAISATGSSGTTARRSPCMIHRRRSSRAKRPRQRSTACWTSC